MANSRQIRAWARENDLEVSDAGPLSSDVRRAYREAHEEAPQPEASIMDEAMPIVDEVAPKVTDDEPMLGRVINRAKKATQAPRSRSRKVVRSSVAKLLGIGYSLLSIPVASFSEPAAYMMTLQQEVAGEILDPVVAGTIVDKILQPFAKVSEKMEPVNALVTPIMCVILMDKFPQMDGKTVPQLRKALASWARIAKPHYDAIKLEEAQFEEEFGKDIDTVIEGLQQVILLSHVKKEQVMAAETWG